MSSTREGRGKGIIKEVLSYKSGAIGIGILIFLVFLSIYTILVIPYDKAIRMWRGQEAMWIDNPRTAAPEWIQFFSSKRLPKTILLDSRVRSPYVSKAEIEIPGLDMKKIVLEFRFTYDFDELPSEFNVFLFSNFSGVGAPLVTINWIKPSGDSITIVKYGLGAPDDKLYISISNNILKTLTSFYSEKYSVNTSERLTVLKLLFGKVDETSLEGGEFEVEKGTYKLVIEAVVFGAQTGFDARAVVYGTVHGPAGTDHLRRPLEIPLLWGAPIALAFGLTASLLTTFIQLLIATISGWYGGWVDSLIQRITEVYMVLPFLPFLIMISVFYKLDIWVILAVVIVLSIFGGGIKGTRALVMQIKEYPYIEAAQAYGASDFRIILFYIIPKILPPVIPGLVSAVPGYVFLEASLSFLGLGDPFLPTWGKVLNDANTNGALYRGLYYWVLEPAIMLMITSFAFAFLGFALDKIVNPRLREM
ncbi:MAG: ABC transporter permease [Thermofilaceae archaeon]